MDAKRRITAIDKEIKTIQEESLKVLDQGRPSKDNPLGKTNDEYYRLTNRARALIRERNSILDEITKKQKKSAVIENPEKEEREITSLAWKRADTRQTKKILSWMKGRPKW